MWAQGFGGPLGFGLLDDLTGKDHYSLGGLYTNSFKPETPGYEGWGQGVGAGLRQIANGGIGVLLDGGGDDLYEYDYMAQGGGYWFGVGWPATSAETTDASAARKTNSAERSERSPSSNDMHADGAVTTPSGSALTTTAMTPTAAPSWVRFCLGHVRRCALRLRGQRPLRSARQNTQGSGGQAGWAFFMITKEKTCTWARPGLRLTQHLLPRFVRVRRQLQLSH